MTDSEWKKLSLPQAKTEYPFTLQHLWDCQKKPKHYQGWGQNMCLQYKNELFQIPCIKKTRCKSRLIDKNTVNPDWIFWWDIIWHHFTFLWSEGCNPAYCLGEFMYNNSRKICSKLINIKHSNQISLRDRFYSKRTAGYPQSSHIETIAIAYLQAE